jgi:malonyl CoA-acyl carrier protein transacylase
LQSIVAFQGLGQRDWPALYKIPNIKQAIQWGNRILRKHDIRVEGRPLNLVEACKKNGLILQEHSQTCWQQPCIFLANMVLWDQWREQNPQETPLLLGFSFGEWSAATAAGCVDRETGLLIATMRGIYTSRAGGSSLLVRARTGGIPVKRLRLRCSRKQAWLSNINSPQQAVISGQTPVIQELEPQLKRLYPDLRITSLALGGPFHTPLMDIPQKQVARWLKDNVKLKKAEFPLMLNATGEITQDEQIIRRMLIRQISARFNFKKRAEEIPPETPLCELCLGNAIIGPLVRQTHQVRFGAKVSKSKALPALT